MKKLRLKLPKQYNVGNLPGAAYSIWSGATIFFGIVSQFMTAGTFFFVAFSRFFPSVELWQFYLVLIIIYPLMAIGVYMFITPSVISFGNSQGYKHENPIKSDLDLIKFKLGITKEEEEAWKKSQGK